MAKPRRPKALLRRLSLLMLMLMLMLVFMFGVPAQAYHLPKWELGVGVAALNLPAYRGARGSENHLLPFPYVVYRGERLRADEEGIRTKLIDRSRFRLDLSLAGNLPVKDTDVEARRGMPELDPIGEIGPTLDWSLWRSILPDNNADVELWLRSPLRAAFSVGDPLLAHRGWVFSPSLDLVYRRGSARHLQRWALSMGPLYATQDFHRYFYEVSPAFVTPTRNEYHASGGYSGARITLSFTIYREDWFFGGFARYDDLSHAVFIDSPLVETDSFFALGLAVSRVFKVSGQKLPH